MGPPPFELVQLSTIPEDQWRGLPVFHPGCQQGDTPYWTGEEDPFELEINEDYDPGPRYDVGVVLDWGPDPDFADLGVIRVHFLGSFGSTLHYASSNLWVPKRFSMNTVSRKARWLPTAGTQRPPDGSRCVVSREAVIDGSEHFSLVVFCAVRDQWDVSSHVDEFTYEPFTAYDYFYALPERTP